ncbi:hypothetical protein SK128_000092 [Halocaridina rubra]|uniref:Uncharacterized protein n=1 Tax=Halocaridina rubra TaxID=373956 RepID=A0AAN8XCE4_HALRR
MLDILKAVIARLIFGGHGFLVIWQAVDTTGEPRYWYLALTLVLLCLETLFTLALKKSKEWRWFVVALEF